MKNNILVISFLIVTQNIFTADDKPSKKFSVDSKFSCGYYMRRVYAGQNTLVKHLGYAGSTFELQDSSGNFLRKLNPDETLQECGLWDLPRDRKNKLIEEVTIIENLDEKDLLIKYGLRGDEMKLKITLITSIEDIKLRLSNGIDRSEDKISLSYNGEILNNLTAAGTESKVKDTPGLWEDPVIHAIISV